MFDLIAEFVFDLVGDMLESGTDAAAEAAAGAATDVSLAAAEIGVEPALDPTAAIAPPAEIAASGATPVEFDNHPVSATLRSAGFSGLV